MTTFHRYIKLSLILAPFKDCKTHPGHFEYEATETTTIHGLKCLVSEHLNESIASVALFKDHSCCEESFLDPKWCLSHCEIRGGPKDSPCAAQVFYDYFPPLTGCPILMDDSHYP